MHDILIIGAGHNGLTCAHYLARKGLKVAILEAADKVELVLPDTGVCDGWGRFDDEVDVTTGAAGCGTDTSTRGGCCGPAVTAGRGDFVSLESLTGSRNRA